MVHVMALGLTQVLFSRSHSDRSALCRCVVGARRLGWREKPLEAGLGEAHAH